MQYGENMQLFLLALVEELFVSSATRTVRLIVLIKLFNALPSSFELYKDIPTKMNNLETLSAEHLYFG